MKLTNLILLNMLIREQNLRSLSRDTLNKYIQEVSEDLMVLNNIHIELVKEKNARTPDPK